MAIPAPALTDEDIQQQVVNELKWHAEVEASEIGVAVREGLVTLTGWWTASARNGPPSAPCGCAGSKPSLTRSRCACRPAMSIRISTSPRPVRVRPGRSGAVDHGHTSGAEDLDFGARDGRHGGCRHRFLAESAHLMVEQKVGPPAAVAVRLHANDRAERRLQQIDEVDSLVAQEPPDAPAVPPGQPDLRDHVVSLHRRGQLLRSGDVARQRTFEEDGLASAGGVGGQLSLYRRRYRERHRVVAVEQFGEPIEARDAVPLGDLPDRQGEARPDAGEANPGRTGQRRRVHLRRPAPCTDEADGDRHRPTARRQPPGR